MRYGVKAFVAFEPKVDGSPFEGLARMRTPTTATGVAAAALAVCIICRLILRRNPTKKKISKNGVVDGVIGAIGNTPLIRIKSLSDATGCDILGKAEFLNPGGSVKDRVAAKIIDDALQSGRLVKGGVVTEGSAGSTAISLAIVARAHGCKCHVVIPDDAAIEKAQILEALGATVERVRPVSITHKEHFVNVARRRAMEANAHMEQMKCNKFENSGKTVGAVGYIKSGNVLDNPSCYDNLNGSVLKNSLEEVQKIYHNTQIKEDSDNEGFLSDNNKGGFFADQFENIANFQAHYEGTAPEIWEQTGGKLDAFVAAAGTGGTVAGVSCFLKDQNSGIRCYLIDPPGSGLYNKVTRGVMYSPEEAEGKRLKNPFDTITEGIGINRLTKNFQMAKLDGAFKGTDREAVEMSRFLMRNDGLFLGSSSAMNCVGAVRVAQLVGPGHTIVTILCDSGMRHLSKFYNNDYLSAQKLLPSASGLEFLNKV